jgi:hypothetical protein
LGYAKASQVKHLPPLLFVAVVLAFAPAGLAQPDTTEPTEINDVQVLLRNNGFRLSRSKFERGIQVRFLVRNTGTRPYRFKVGSFSTKLLKRGKHQILLAYLGVRGRFAVEQWDARERISRLYIRVV